VVEERLRIARDLHDVLAHTVSVMTVQAGVAAEAVDRDPDAAHRSLTAIRRAGRAAMQEVRATVAVLRTGAGPDGTAPAPGIEDLAELAAAVRDQGLDVRIEVPLEDEAVPEVLGLTVYRVVQEGLTNVVRHAGASSVLVRVVQAGSTLDVEVRDDGSGGDGTPPGLGLRGMAERVEALGGSLHHGRDGAAGWVVRASLPVEALR
jgi:signal transduction histidine kinase